MKTTVAVIFGGQSCEHDVSIITGIQTALAIDSTKYEVLTVYIDKHGAWWSGDLLLDLKSYPITKKSETLLNKIELPIGIPFNRNPYFKKQGIFGGKIFFDVAFFALHGGYGENGGIQGLFDVAGIPYVGCGTLGSSVLMDKNVAKMIFKSAGIAVLPHQLVHRPAAGTLNIEKLLDSVDVSFPSCVKPCNLGSSVGVFKVKDKNELHSAVLAVLKIDTCAMIEPFVDNLVEYNVAVTKAFDGESRTSAIEMPIKKDDKCISFSDKYLHEGGLDKLNSKLFSSGASDGMASAAREINPNLSNKQKETILSYAKKAFAAISGRGAPRADFLCNQKTGEIWLNEINPIPGSLGHYLWESAEQPVNFTSLTSALINEAITTYNTKQKNSEVNLKNTGSLIF